MAELSRPTLAAPLMLSELPDTAPVDDSAAPATVPAVSAAQETSLYTQGFPTATILQLQTQQSSSAQETTSSCEEFQVQNCSCSHGAAT